MINKAMKKKKGAILLEMLLALAIGSAILTAASVALVGSQQASLQSYQKQQAELNLQEISEAVKSAKLSGWENISINGTYHPEISSGDWVLVDGEETIDIYTRKIEIEDVFRDDEGNIVDGTGTLDPSAKKITSTISWEKPRQDLILQTFFLTRWQDNETWIEDTLEDFTDGTEDAADAAINPGYVQLAQTGGGGWTEPGSIGVVDGESKASGICATDSYIYLTPDKLWGGAEVFDIQDFPDIPFSVGSF